MATHICCTASLDGFEAAKRCQAALEEEILSNVARIEVVKKVKSTEGSLELFYRN